MSKSIKTNFLYSSILTSANYIFPILTYPYVSRVLGVEKIGACNFVESIVAYFLLLSMMGIRTVGVRDIAKAKNNPSKLNSVFSSLVSLNTISTIIAVSILFVATVYVPQLWQHKELMLLGGIRLLFSYLQIEWLFLGLEDFRYITYRTMLIKMAYVVLVFLFVRDEDDYVVYFGLTTITTIASVLVNLKYATKFVKFKYSLIKVAKYIKPYFVLGVYMILTSMYTSFNVAFLGFSAGDIEVGYYTTATKLYGILLSLFTAFTGVMLPRMSSLLSENKKDEFIALVYRSFNILISYSMPIICISACMAPQIIRILSGNGYEGAILPMRIVMPLMLVIGIEQILIIQTLMPLGEDNKILYNSIIGAVFGLVLNFILVPQLRSIGSSIVWICSESAVLICAYIAVRKKINIKLPESLLIKNILLYIPLYGLLYYAEQSIKNDFLSLVVAATLTILYALMVNIRILKNQEFMLIFNQIKSYVKK